MAEESRPAALDRIERAIARLETAATAHRTGRDALTRRHAALRSQVEAAVAALDGLIEPV